MPASILSTILSLGPYHLLSWGTLVGMELYQSFVMTKLCYRHLPMKEFTQLQEHVFPAYFAGQAGLVALTAATYPPASLYSLATSKAIWTVHLPLGVNLAMAGLNAIVYGPRTSAVMIEREKMRTKGRGGDSNYGTSTANAAGEAASEEEIMKKIRKDFSRNHAMAIHLNAIGMIATVWYGVGLASKLKFVA